MVSLESAGSTHLAKGSIARINSCASIQLCVGSENLSFRICVHVASTLSMSHRPRVLSVFLNCVISHTAVNTGKLVI